MFKAIFVGAYTRLGRMVPAHERRVRVNPATLLAGDPPPLPGAVPTPVDAQPVKGRLARAVRVIGAAASRFQADKRPQAASSFADEEWTDERLEAWRRQQGANPSAEELFARTVHPPKHQSAIQRMVRDQASTDITHTQRTYLRACIERDYWRHELNQDGLSARERDYAQREYLRSLNVVRSIDARTGWPSDYLRPIEDPVAED